MANVIRNQRIVDNNKRNLTKVVIYSDGSEEANTRIIDASNLQFSLNANGYIMSGNTHTKSNYRTTVKRITGTSSGTDSHIRLQWEGDANSEIITFGQGNFDFDFQSMGDGAVISNPEANATGDVLISTSGLDAGDTITLFIDLRKDSRDYDAGQTADPTAFNRGPAAGP
jgi:hypothetical protein